MCDATLSYGRAILPVGRVTLHCVLTDSHVQHFARFRGKDYHWAGRQWSHQPITTA